MTTSTPTLPRSDVPRPPAHAVERAALQACLADAIAAHRIVLLMAPAGFGKTTALAQLAARMPPGSAAWIDAEAGDDAHRLGLALVAALEPFDLPWRHSPVALVDALHAGPGAVPAFAVRLGEALAATEIERGLLVLDELHLVQDAHAFELLKAVLSRLPPQWTVAISARNPLPLPVARWLIEGVLAELGQQQLRFSGDDVALLLARVGRPPEDAAQVLAASQGWPAAAALMARTHGAQGVDAALGRQHLFDYLASEVLVQLPAPVAAFLQRCAVLREWSAARCAAVTGETQAEAHLALVEARGLFVTRRDTLPPALVPDELFREFLERQLRLASPEAWRELLLRAAATEPSPPARITHLLAAGEPAAAASALVEAAELLLARGNAGALPALLERFPAGSREALPEWQFARACLALVRWDWPVLETATRLAAQGFAAGKPERAGLAPRCLVMRTLALVGLGALDEARAAAARLHGEALPAADRALLASADTWIAAAQGPAEAPAAALGRMLDALLAVDSPALWLQCLPNFRFATMAACRPVIERFAHEALRRAGEDALPLRMGANLLLAWTRLLAAEMDAARALLAQVDEDARWWGLPRSLQWSRDSVAALIAALRGDALTTHRLMAALAAHFPQGNAWRRMHLGYWMRLCWLLDDTAGLDRLHAELAASVGVGEWPIAVACGLVGEAQHLLAHGRPAAAEQRLTEAIAHIGEADASGLLGSACGLRALARLRSGRAAEAWEALAPVAAGNRLAHDAMGVLILGPRSLDELARLPVPRSDAQVGARLTAMANQGRAWRHPAAAQAAPAPDCGPLSPRERDVLERLAAGESNKVIARSLNLSPHTVKRHVANIFNKLGVSTRAQAAVWLRAVSPP